MWPFHGADVNPRWIQGEHGPEQKHRWMHQALCISLLLWVRLSLTMERAMPVREAGQKNSIVFSCSNPFRIIFFTRFTLSKVWWIQKSFVWLEIFQAFSAEHFADLRPFQELQKWEEKLPGGAGAFRGGWESWREVSPWVPSCTAPPQLHLVL